MQLSLPGTWGQTPHEAAEEAVLLASAEAFPGLLEIDTATREADAAARAAKDNARQATAAARRLRSVRRQTRRLVTALRRAQRLAQKNGSVHSAAIDALELIAELIPGAPILA